MFNSSISQFGNERRNKLYYADKDGFNESQTVCSEILKEGYNDIRFRIDASENELRMVRFDPGEKENLILDDLIICVIPEEGKLSEFKLKDCCTNGIERNERVYFHCKDPNITVQLPSPVKVKEVQVLVSAVIEPNNAALVDFFQDHLPESKMSFSKKLKSMYKKPRN